MKHLPLLFFLCIGILLSSCNSGNHLSKKNFKLTVTYPSKKLQAGDQIKLVVNSKLEMDSVTYSYAQHRIAPTEHQPTLETILQRPLGEHPISATIFYKGDSIVLSKNIVLHADKRPILYTYKIINSYPHDPLAFTQGLEFYKDTLYEGTGMYGVSELRKVDLKTGKILQKTKLDKQYFGEGITILNDKVYQLTWREGIGFVYDLPSLKQEKTFSYDQSKEGWGLCNDGKLLYKSDGTDKIWIIDPENMEEKSFFNPVTNTSLASKVNELEWVKGKIYANTWQKDGVLIIDPSSGIVEGVIDFRGLKEEQENEKADVLNGIAYLPKEDKLYVTGKYWDRIFEVEIIEKD